MKVSRIEIKDFQQFKDFTIDLTYPKGHELEGQPLKKICFIGQSGTGKTTILDVICDLINNIRFTNNGLASSLKKLNLRETTEMQLIFQYEEYSKKLRNSDITLKNGEYSQGKTPFDTIEDIGNIAMKIMEEYIEIEKKIAAIYLETGLEKQIQLLAEENEIINNKLLANTPKYKGQITESAKEFYKVSKIIKSSYDFYFDSFKYFLLSNLNEYDKKYASYLQELPQKLKNRNPHEVAEELQKWSIENPNPRVEIAKRLNQKLGCFNLKIDEEWTKGGILIKNLQNEPIPLEGISTGTKQVLLNAIILYFLNTKGKVILFDEPENSLFPDIQRTLINYYADLAPEAQFFFATHSPLIASQFEPCERFILSFDENGNVQARNGIAPEGDDPNDLLSKDFGLQNLLGEKGIEAFERFITLKMQIRQEKDQEKSDSLMNEYLTLQRAYNF